MLVKFLAHGKGSARAAVEYLVGERDAVGHEREGVEVVRGNPDMVATVADSLDFERRYTSAVIVWAPLHALEPQLGMAGGAPPQTQLVHELPRRARVRFGVPGS